MVYFTPGSRDPALELCRRLWDTGAGSAAALLNSQALSFGSGWPPPPPHCGVSPWLFLVQNQPKRKPRSPRESCSCMAAPCHPAKRILGPGPRVNPSIATDPPVISS